MFEQAQFALCVLAAAGCGLVAGTFFAFSSFVMRALGRLPPQQGIAAMQSINVAVLNRSFLSLFLGTAALSVVLAVAAGLRWQSTGDTVVVAASLIYLVACFGVTVRRNVPLNHALAAVTAATPQADQLWAHYLSRWTDWNTLRSCAATVSMVLYIVSLRA